MNKFVLPAVGVIIILGAIAVYAAKAMHTDRDSSTTNQAMMHDTALPTATADTMMHDTITPSPTPDAMMSH